MKKWIFITAVSIFALTGCGREKLAPAPMETVTKEYTREEETRQEEESESQMVNEIKTEAVIPTKYEIYTDGEPHFVLYHADSEHTYFGEFTNISFPELGVESVSFLSHLVEPSEEVLHPYDENEFIIDSTEKAMRVFDLTALDTIPDDEFHRYCFAIGRCGVFSVENAFMGIEPTEAETDRLLWDNFSIATAGEIEMRADKDGNNLYIVHGGTAADAGNEKIFYGFTIFRILKDEVQGVYLFVDESYENSLKYLDYTLQSLSFTRQRKEG